MDPPASSLLYEMVVVLVVCALAAWMWLRSWRAGNDAFTRRERDRAAMGMVRNPMGQNPQQVASVAEDKGAWVHDPPEDVDAIFTVVRDD